MQLLPDIHEADCKKKNNTNNFSHFSVLEREGIGLFSGMLPIKLIETHIHRQTYANTQACTRRQVFTMKPGNALPHLINLGDLGWRKSRF